MGDRNLDLGYNPHYLTQDIYKSRLEVLIAMCFPTVLDIVLDYLNFTSPSSSSRERGSKILESSKLVFMAGLFIPSVLTYAFSLDPPKGLMLYRASILCGETMVFGALLNIVHFHDQELWTVIRVDFVHGLQLSGAVAMNIFFLTHNHTFRIIYYGLFRSSMGFFCIMNGYWMYKHRTSLYDVFISRTDVTMSLSNDKILQLFYTALMTFLIFSFAIIVLIFDVTAFFLLHLQILMAMAIVLFPGRLAKRNALQSDVSIRK